MPQGRPIDSEEELRHLGEMLVDLSQAERLLTSVHQRAVALGYDDIARHLDSELFWKLGSASDFLRDLFDMERVHGGHM